VIRWEEKTGGKKGGKTLPSSYHQGKEKRNESEEKLVNSKNRSVRGTLPLENKGIQFFGDKMGGCENGENLILMKKTKRNNLR